MVPDSPPCACLSCVSACARPCWPIPEEAQGIMDAGLGSKLMLDWWDGVEDDHGHRVFILCPANPSYERKQASDAPVPSGIYSLFLRVPTHPLKSGCVMQTRDGRCVLHGTHVNGVLLKPAEGRKQHCSRPGITSDLHKDVALTWDTEIGKQVVQRWLREYGDADANNFYLFSEDED